MNTDYTDSVDGLVHALVLKGDGTARELDWEALLTEETRPRSTQIGNGLLIAMRGVNLNPNAEP